MTALAALLDLAPADPLAGGAGERRIGMFGAEVPIELVLAAGARPVQLPASPPGPTRAADRHLESGFAPAARLVLQDWIDGRLDALEAVLFTRSSDNSQRLYYYVCELRRRGLLGGPEPLLYDLAKIRRPTSLAHTRRATAILAERLEARDLAGGIARVDRRRALFQTLAERRAGWPGSQIARVLHIAGHAPFDAFDAALAAALAEERVPVEGPRLLLVGSPPVDDGIARLIEAAGGVLAGELHEYGLARHGPPIGMSDRPLDAIADAYHALALGTRSFADRPEMVRAAARTAAADGVLFWLIEEEEALVWDLPGQVRAIAAEGLPTLVRTRARSGADHDTSAAIADFTRSLKGAR